jgi:hypothetical protein
MKNIKRYFKFSKDLWMNSWNNRIESAVFSVTECMAINAKMTKRILDLILGIFNQTSTELGAVFFS